MKAFISGTVMSVYTRDRKDRNGVPVTVYCADVYCGHEIVSVMKTPKGFPVGKKYDKIPVNIYWNQYGNSVVYDNSEF